MSVTITREKAEQLWKAYQEDPELELVEMEISPDGKLRAFRIEVERRRKPLALSGEDRWQRPSRRQRFDPDEFIEDEE